MKTLQYFAYGSNMYLPRLLERVPSAKVHTTARLNKHQLKFHKASTVDDSAKCDAYHTGSLDHVVYGVVFHFNAADKSTLDKAEGLNYGYEEKVVSVYSEELKQELEAYTYYATRLDNNLKPYDWYKAFVLEGAKDHGLPAEYIKVIEHTEHEIDPDSSRAVKNWAILDKA